MLFPTGLTTEQRIDLGIKRELWGTAVQGDWQCNLDADSLNNKEWVIFS
jgi:hypothetical protein